MFYAQRGKPPSKKTSRKMTPFTTPGGKAWFLKVLSHFSENLTFFDDSLDHCKSAEYLSLNNLDVVHVEKKDESNEQNEQNEQVSKSQDE